MPGVTEQATTAVPAAVAASPKADPETTSRFV
jgi:hypothetical protein